MLRYLVLVIFTAALLGLSANPTVIHAQTNEQATEPDQATQSDENSDQAASPEDSNQTDQTEQDSDADQPADESDQPAGNGDAGPQDQDQ